MPEVSSMEYVVVWSTMEARNLSRECISLDEKRTRKSVEALSAHIWDLLYGTPSVPNYRSFDFCTLSLTTRLIQKFVQNITSSVVVCFINTNSSLVT